LLVSNLMGALSWIGRWYRPDGPMSAKEVAKHSIDMLLFGISPAKRGKSRAARMPQRVK
jgi:hypothetical protein